MRNGPTRKAGLCLLALSALNSVVNAVSPTPDGRTLSFESNYGNCLACHQIPGGKQMGDIGPPLENMRARFPDRKRLFDQIWDASAFNVDSMMPPYGRQQILTEAEINAIIDFLYEN